MPKSIVADSCIFSFIKNCQTFSEQLYHFTFPLAVLTSVLVSLHPCQHLVFLRIFVFDILMSV